MSFARQIFLETISAIQDAVDLESVSGGSSFAAPKSVVVLRRGIIITSLIAFETFVRARTAENLDVLKAWPRSFSDLPAKLREAALLGALDNLHSFAMMLRRNQADFEVEIKLELAKMAATDGPVFGFSKFVAGDFTGNLDVNKVKELLGCFKVQDCWNSFHRLASEIGFGIPSIEEALKEIVRNRHRSAHAQNYVPSANDVTSLPSKLVCLGICFDAAQSSAVNIAVKQNNEFMKDRPDWRKSINIYFTDPYRNMQYSLKKQNAKKSLKILSGTEQAASSVPVAPSGEINLLVLRSKSSIPVSWDIR